MYTMYIISRSYGFQSTRRVVRAYTSLRLVYRTVISTRGGRRGAREIDERTNGFFFVFGNDSTEIPSRNKFEFASSDGRRQYRRTIVRRERWMWGGDIPPRAYVDKYTANVLEKIDFYVNFQNKKTETRAFADSPSPPYPGTTVHPVPRPRHSRPPIFRQTKNKTKEVGPVSRFKRTLSWPLLSRTKLDDSG